MRIIDLEYQDPFEELKYSPVSGLIHRHPDRVILLTTNQCKEYCDFCFRKYSIQKVQNILSNIENVINYIEDNPKIWEVILSGGDPLSLSNNEIGSILKKLNKIEHVKIIRIHTRYPVCQPERINRTFIKLISNTLKFNKAVYIVFHINTIDEITSNFEKVCDKLVSKGIPLLSQTVLLKGINNSSIALQELFRKLIEIRIKPYYLHHPDLVKGTNKYRTTIKEGQELVNNLRRNNSGLCQPAYIIDIPICHEKVTISQNYIDMSIEGDYIIKDTSNNEYLYPYK
jgi:lysine 2,3-aminomutase